jgi:DNA (cytosine-5)-methyltransferase 1
VSELIVDNFAGGGGASLGIERALGRPVDYAINHDPEAIAMHRANHPRTQHLLSSVWDVNPRKLCAGRSVGLGWFSPDCTFHSKARGAKPFRDRDQARRRRGLAWLIPYWMRTVRPRVVCLENVEEFANWGPLLKSGRPDPRRKGSTFRRWVSEIENLGYRVDMRELRAHEYGAPTIRKRLFVVARCDGGEIIFPEATHGPALMPYRTAAECIDWSIPCPSIFDRKRPLVEATIRRLARGVMRYVVEDPHPFIVTLRGTEHSHLANASRPVDEPLRTISAAGTHHALVLPFLTEHANASHQRLFAADEPLRTQCANVKGGHFALVAPMLVNTRNGERAGQAPRVRDVTDPHPTITAAGSQGALGAVFLARHYGGHENDGAPLASPFYTVTSKDHHALVYAFLMKYYGTEQDPRLDAPLATVTTKDRFGLVTVKIAGEPFVIADVGMRMLTPRELYRAQSFPDTYQIDPWVDGRRLPKVAQVRMVGNSVPPVMSEALVRANYVEQLEEQAA